MRYKPKYKKTTVIILIVGILAAVLASQLGFASTRSATRIGYVGNEGWRSWSGSYFFMDGTLQKTIHPKDGTVHVEVETESGTFSMTVKDPEGNILFQGSEMQTTSFDLEVPEKIVVRITAKSHKGSFSVG